MFPLINERLALEKVDDRLRDAKRDRLRREARDAAKQGRAAHLDTVRARVDLVPRRAADAPGEA